MNKYLQVNIIWFKFPQGLLSEIYKLDSIKAEISGIGRKFPLIDKFFYCDLLKNYQQ